MSYFGRKNIGYSIYVRRDPNVIIAPYLEDKNIKKV